MMRIDLARTALCFALIVSLPAVAKAQGVGVAEHGKGVEQDKQQEVVRFLNLLKADRPASRKFNVQDVPKWDVKSIAGFIHPNGLAVEDVNVKSAKKYSPAEVEQALSRKKGDVFQSFSHISFLYAKGKKQYSALEFADTPGGVRVKLATWYEMEFAFDGSSLKLKKCRYINSDAD